MREGVAHVVDGGDAAAAFFRRPAFPMRNATPGDVVSPDELLALIRRRYAGLVQTTTWGARALRYNAGDALARGVDFVTVEERDGATDVDATLEEMGAYRVSVAVSPERYGQLFAESITPHVVDTLVPHPIDAQRAWASVVNPTAATIERLLPLLDEGYHRARQAWTHRESLGTP